MPTADFCLRWCQSSSGGRCYHILAVVLISLADTHCTPQVGSSTQLQWPRLGQIYTEKPGMEAGWGIGMLGQRVHLKSIRQVRQRIHFGLSIRVFC